MLRQVVNGRVWFAFDVQLLMSAHTFPSSRLHSVVAFQDEALEGNNRMHDVIRDFANKQVESIGQKYFAVCLHFQIHYNNKTKIQRSPLARPVLVSVKQSPSLKDL